MVKTQSQNQTLLIPEQKRTKNTADKTDCIGENRAIIEKPNF